MKRKINTRELYEILKLTPPDQNIMLAGKHGIGKSQILTTYFENKKMKVVTMFLGQMSDPGDLIGLPRLNPETGKTEFMPPYWFPTDGKPIVLFLDELNRARPEILQTIMDLALNKTLAGRKLPEGSRIISAVNSGDEYQLTDLDPALVSRFNIYNFQPDVKDWLTWAEGEGLDPRVIDYIRKNPNKLDSVFMEDGDNLEKSPDRRAWKRVSDITAQIDIFKAVHIKVLSGIIGETAAADFITAESEKEVTKITGFDILNDGSSVFPALSALKITDISLVIDSIFANLEESESLSDITKKRYAKNLDDFIEHLKTTKNNESTAYFISVYTNTEFYVAKNFVADNCAKTIEIIKEFVKTYNVY